MAVVIKRFDVYLANPDPAIGSEIQKTRSCLVISPDEMNLTTRTVIIAPMTAAQKAYPTRVACTFHKKKGQIVLDQLRTIDKARLVKKLDPIDPKAQLDIISILQKLLYFNIQAQPAADGGSLAHTIIRTANSSTRTSHESPNNRHSWPASTRFIV